MTIEENLNRYLGESKKINIERIAKDITNNIDMDYIIYENIKRYFEGEIPLSNEQENQLYKKIKTNKIFLKVGISKLLTKMQKMFLHLYRVYLRAGQLIMIILLSKY